MKKDRKIQISAVILNSINAVLVLLSIISFFVGEGAGNMDVSGTNCFKYFTIDSNILSAITSLIVIPFLFKKETPNWVTVAKFVGTVAVSVTFLTVVFFLGPTQGYAKMFDGVCLYLHLFCPVISIITLYLPEIKKPLPEKSWLFGILPVAIYGTVYAIMVIFAQKWQDFYGFNIKGFWYISFVGMTLICALLSLFMSYLHRKAVSEK